MQGQPVTPAVTEVLHLHILRKKHKENGREEDRKIK